MSVDLYRELSWLPKAPPDFSSRCKELAANAADFGKQARVMATHALDERQLSRLGSAISRLRPSFRFAWA